ncbi:MAG TPA: MEDS domain-containing protein [Micromonosporaceae bacterium]|nr:MEDS domain-containing protein [Micromonosporaceae bacterium]
MAEATAVDLATARDHACLTFTDPEERLDLVARFVREGLRQRDKIICWSDELAPETLAKEFAARAVRPGSALRRGQLSIAPASESPLVREPGGAQAMIRMLSGEISRAEREGYRGLRVTMDMACVTRPAAAADQLMGFETDVAALCAEGRLCMFCQYDRDRFDAVTLAFAAQAHPVTVAAQVYHESPLLRVCRQYSPSGLRVAGEIDYRHGDLFEQALGEAIRLDRHPRVNLRALDYIDAAAAAVLVRAALRLPGSRFMHVSCGRLVATMVEMVGGREAAQLRVHRVDGEL